MAGVVLAMGVWHLQSEPAEVDSQPLSGLSGQGLQVAPTSASPRVSCADGAALASPFARGSTRDSEPCSDQPVAKPPATSVAAAVVSEPAGTVPAATTGSAASIGAALSTLADCLEASPAAGGRPTCHEANPASGIVPRLWQLQAMAEQGDAQAVAELVNALKRQNQTRLNPVSPPVTSPAPQAQAQQLDIADAFDRVRIFLLQQARPQAVLTQ